MPITVSTPLGPDAFAVTGFSGHEGLSQLFGFRVEVVADSGRQVPFEALLGQPVSVRLEPPAGPVRHFSGVCSRVAQGDALARRTPYQLDVVPKLWLLTQTSGSRAYANLSVPEILERVLFDADASIELRVPFARREYVVQYRETDFAFVSRLMEEEGIYYFFRHEDGGHTMVVTSTPAGHPELPAVQFDPRARFGTVHEWTKAQELRSGKVTLWDHHFQVPESKLEGAAVIQESVAAGPVRHTLRPAGVERLELYDYPGGYAARFDGIGPGGEEQPGELERLFGAAQQQAELRMESVAASALTIAGASTVPALTPGHVVTLEGIAGFQGRYLVESVRHTIETGSPASGRLSYRNTFTCIPEGLAYRPPRTTPRPVVAGLQSAVVVGPPGEEIFADRYGRVKVQFHWDREPKASVWIRVAAPYAGPGRGFALPEVGDEVLVGFEEGDVRRPYVIGGLWNAADPPPPREDDR